MAAFPQRNLWWKAGHPDCADGPPVGFAFPKPVPDWVFFKRPSHTEKRE